MYIFGINIDTKAELKNIKSLLKVGEIIEVKVISKKGKNLYLLQVKGNMFEGLSTKEIDKGNLNTYVESVGSNIILQSEKDKDLKIRLGAFLKKTKQSIDYQHNVKHNNVIIKTGNGTKQSDLLLKQGDIVNAKIILKKSPSVYVLKINKATFEAITNIKGLFRDDKLTLFVERVKPEIVLKIIDKNREKIEYVKGSGEVFIKSSKSHLDEVSKALQDLYKAVDLSDKKSSLAALQKFTNVLKDIKISVENLRDFINMVRSAISQESIKDANLLEQFVQERSKPKEVRDSVIDDNKPQRQNFKNIQNSDMPENKNIRKMKGVFIKNILEGMKTNEPLSLLIGRIFNKDIDRILNVDMSDVKNSAEKLSTFFNMVFLESSYKNIDNSHEKGLVHGFFKELSEGLDKIFNNIVKMENNATEIEKAIFEFKEQIIKDKILQMNDVLKNNLMKSKERISKKFDTQKIFEDMKDILRQVKPPVNSNNLFVQIPVFINDKKGYIYIKKEKEEYSNNNKKSFKIRVISDSDSLGIVQIEGLYFDGSVICNVGFDTKNILEKFNSNIEMLENSLGEDVSISTFLIKSKPVILQKRLNIKI